MNNEKRLKTITGGGTRKKVGVASGGMAARFAKPDKVGSVIAQKSNGSRVTATTRVKLQEKMTGPLESRVKKKQAVLSDGG